MDHERSIQKDFNQSQDVESEQDISKEQPTMVEQEQLVPAYTMDGADEVHRESYNRRLEEEQERFSSFNQTQKENSQTLQNEWQQTQPETDYEAMFKQAREEAEREVEQEQDY